VFNFCSSEKKRYYTLTMISEFKVLEIELESSLIEQDTPLFKLSFNSWPTISESQVLKRNNLIGRQ